MMGIADVRWQRFKMHPREIYVSARLGPVVCCCECKLEESVFLTKYYLGYQIKDQMSGACSTNEGAKTCIQGFGGET